jgi:phage terminase small subunit
MVADRAAALSEVVATAGVVDVAEGAKLLAASDDIAVQSALVGAMSEEDLAIGMDLASIAGQMWAVSTVTEIMDMPVLSAFLARKNDELHDIAVESMLRFGAARVLSAAMSASGADVADLGVEEIAEGLTRLAVSEDLAIKSELLAEEGAATLVAGMNELEESAVLDEVAKDVAAEGVAEVAVGSAELGASEVLAAVAESEEEAEDIE